MYHYPHTKSSSHHKFNLKLKQILGINEIKGHISFDHAHLKIIEVTFSLYPNLYQHVKNQFILSIHSFFFWSYDWTGHTHFDHAHPNSLQLTFKFGEFLSTCKKSKYFIDSLWRYSWFKNSPILLAEGTLTHIFPNGNMGLV